MGKVRKDGRRACRVCRRLYAATALAIVHVSRRRVAVCPACWQALEREAQAEGGHALALVAERYGRRR